MLPSEHNKIIRNWLLTLGTTCRPEPDSGDVKSRVATYVGFLGEMDLGVFTAESLKAVLSECEFFPSYKTLRGILDKWWAEHKPAPALRLTGPDGVQLSVMDDRWVAYWMKRILETDCQGWGRRRSLLHLIRERAPDAFGYLVQTDTLAASIGVSEGWVRGSKARESDEDLATRMRAEWDNRDWIARRVVRLREIDERRGLALLRALVGKWAPQHLDLLSGHDLAVPG